MYVEEAICEFLREEIFPQLAPPPYGEIEMTSLGTQKPVCLFFEKKRNIMVVGKLFKWGVVPLEDAWLGADKEYLNLKLLREQLGMDVDATDDNEIDVIEHYKTLLVEYEINTASIMDVMGWAHIELTRQIEARSDAEIQQLYNQLFNRDYH